METGDMLKIIPIPAFQDNYIWAIIHGHQVAVIDPGDAAAVEAFLQAQQLELTAILVTHWHPDHTGGIDQLTQQDSIPVYGPQSEHIPQVSQPVSDGDYLPLFDIHLQVIAVPGHTFDHIAYYSADAESLFCGDTLFAGGCGRIFEGTPQMMFDSLNKLAQLPAKTYIYCAHEYTLANLQFALEAEPGNTALQQRLINCQQQRDKQQPTLPCTLNDELMTNPFLRCTEPNVITQALNQGAASDRAVDVFACLREWKNNT